MTSKQRVHAALKREPVDRVPVFMWFHPETARQLGRLLEIPAAQVGAAMGNDVCQAWVGNNYAMEGIVHEYDEEAHLDDWGIEWVKEGAFNQIRHSPLKSATDAQIAAYRFPEHRFQALLANLAPVMAQAEEMFAGCDVSPCVFEMMWRLRGMENAILDLGDESPVINGLLERCGDFARQLAELACGRFALDWLWTGDDIGGQQAMIISPECWRRQIGPHLAPVVAVGKSRGLWVAFHSCGAVRPIIADLIAMGVDVLNPVQGNCPGMNPLELKSEFGRQLAFMGGVDNQELLPRGSAAAVRREIARLLEGMTAGGGGYILAASHTVPPETPQENIFAMYEAAGISRQEIFDKAAGIRRHAAAAASGTGVGVAASSSTPSTACGRARTSAALPARDAATNNNPRV